MSVNLSTVQRWQSDVDSLGEWFRYDKSQGKVDRVFCALCTKHRDRLSAVRNFSSSFIDGIRGSALKKDNVVKHTKSDMHVKAMDMERKPARTISDILRTTPLGKAVASASAEETARVTKLMEISYMLAKEELPFSKYPCIEELEKRHDFPNC